MPKGVYRHSPEANARMSAALTGRKLSPEHRANIAAGATGRILGPESRAKISLTNRKHGHAGKRAQSRTYQCWAAMLRRCRNPRVKEYPHYGGRGISVCARWRRFENFLADMGEKPTGLSIDRIDNDGNYEPINCRWATAKQQANNRRGAA